jgi:hypothetical protein
MERCRTDGEILCVFWRVQENPERGGRWGKLQKNIEKSLVSLIVVDPHGPTRASRRVDALRGAYQRVTFGRQEAD